MRLKFFFVLVFSLTVCAMEAQNSQVLYFMNLPQNHFLNPALKQTNNVYVGLPGITGVNVNISNNFLSFPDLFVKGTEIDGENFAFFRSDFDVDKFLGKIKDMNYIEPEVSVQLLGLGFSLGKGLYVFLDVTDNANVEMIIPRDYFRLAFTETEQFAGQTFDLSSARLDYKYYREVGIGASKQISPKLRIGGKARALFGITAGTLQNYSLDLTVNNDYSSTLDANMAFDFSGPVNIIRNSDNSIEEIEIDEIETGAFLTNMRNAGFGIDLGAEYSVTDRIVLSAALTDIGFIKWKTNLSHIEAVGDIRMSGINIYDVQEGNASVEDFGNSFLDSLQQALVSTGEGRSFTTRFPVGATLAGKYILNDKISFGLLSYSRISEQQLRQAVTLSANLNLKKSFGASLAYTVCNHTYSNVGLGLYGRASVFQFYFLIDRIPLNWERAGDSNNSFALPANWNTLHTRLGLNLVFGNK